jgi:S-adenosyl-L-methionine hydrolase (adenosine-forming)
MAVITLTTDWQNDDYYPGAVKGVILSIDPKALIADISHKVNLFNTAQAIFVLKNAYTYYPEGSIHLLCVNSEATQEFAHIAFRFKGHYFIGCNNGAFGLLLDEEEPDEIVKIDKFSLANFLTFPALNVFAPAAAYISKGGKLSGLGTPVNKINRQVPMLPTIGESVIAGTVIYIDSYRNIITNVSRELFIQIGKDRKFEILVQSYHYRINKINKSYNESASGELLAIFNSAGLLEIAINRGNVADLLNLGLNSNVRIKFGD